MKPGRRARSPENKADRRNELLRVAAEVFDEVPYAKITIADVAARAGLAKGTVYLYFKSKEELFLGVLEALLFAWYDVVDERLDAAHGELSIDELVEILRVADGAPIVTRLLALVSGVLEHNVSLEAASRYKPQLWMHMTKTGAKLEAKWPHFRKGEGFRFLGHLALFIIGARQLADLPPVIGHVIDTFGLSGFRFDFDEELENLVKIYLRGLENRPREAGKPEKVATKQRVRARH